MHRLPIGRILFALIACTIAWWWWQNCPLRHAPVVLVAQEPVQEDAGETGKTFGTNVNGFKLTGVAHYVVRGRVLGRKRYHSGARASLRTAA